MKVENRTARPITLNVMVEGSPTRVMFTPGAMTLVEKGAAAQIKKDPYFKANVKAENLKVLNSKSDDSGSADKGDFVYTTVEDFLKDNVKVASANAKFLTLEQLDEAVQAEELKGEGEARTTLVSALIKAAEDLDA